VVFTEARHVVDDATSERYAQLQDVQQPESRRKLRVLLSRVRLFWRGGVAELKLSA
jgi:hypothetical protein